MRKILLCIILTWIPACAGMTGLLLHGYFNPLHAQENSAVTFLNAAELNENKTLIANIEAYLTSLTTIASNFNQVAPDGTLTSGKFYMQRPGKMRWQYNPPTPILMVANGIELVFYDYELEQVNHIPLNDSIISFLAREKIQFGGDIGILSVEDKEGVIRIEVAELKKPTEGRILLEFSKTPLLIRNMVITDATNQVTSVSLSSAEFGKKLDKELFIWRDPRKPRKRT
ncbi:MAG: LolA family protein [Alphaproteobacteria bacterium]